VGSSVGIGALIMGVTLLSVFAVATTVISNQAAVALEVTDPDVIDKPELSLTNLANSGSVQAPLDVQGAGGGYYPGTLVFAGDCEILPSGTFSVTSESWQLGPFQDENSPTSGIYDGEHFSFQELDDEAGAVSNWYVWFNVDGDDADPAPGGIGIEVTVNLGDTGETIRDNTITELNNAATLTEIVFTPGADTIQATYSQSGPAVDVVVSNPATGPFPILSSNDGGGINVATLADGGSGCTGTPTISLVPNSPGGAGGLVVVDEMEWDYTYVITNDGSTTVKLSEIFITLNGGATDVLSSTPAFTVEYLFPGETINVFTDADSENSLTRVAISSHGMNIAVET